MGSNQQPLDQSPYALLSYFGWCEWWHYGFIYMLPVFSSIHWCIIHIYHIIFPKTENISIVETGEIIYSRQQARAITDYVYQINMCIKICVSNKLYSMYDAATFYLNELLTYKYKLNPVIHIIRNISAWQKLALYIPHFMKQFQRATWDAYFLRHLFPSCLGLAYITCAATESYQTETVSEGPAWEQTVTLTFDLWPDDTYVYFFLYPPSISWFGLSC